MLIEKDWEDRKIQCPEDLASVFLEIISDLEEYEKDKEHIWVVGMDTSGKIKYIDLVAIGSLSHCLFHPREIFRMAVHQAVHSIMVVHNHPSNNVEPSREDYTMLEKLTDSGKILGIPVVDSLIFQSEGQEYYSITGDGRFTYMGG